MAGLRDGWLWRWGLGGWGYGGVWNSKGRGLERAK